MFIIRVYLMHVSRKPTCFILIEAKSLQRSLICTHFCFLKIRIEISIKKEMEANFCTLHKSTEPFTFFERLNTSPEVDVIFKRVQHVLNGIEWYF